MHSVQVIKGKKLFVIIETMFSVSNSKYAELIEDLDHHLKCNGLRANPNCVNLPTIHTSDREVNRIASSDRLN